MRINGFLFLRGLSGLVSSLCMQIRTALIVGLPEDANTKNDQDTHQQRNVGPVCERSSAGELAHRHRDDASGYMTRNGLGSLEVGAFRDRTGE